MERTFGERLAAWLKARGIRPAQLARAVGVSRPTMHAWLTDAAAPRNDRLAAIAAALNITQSELFSSPPSTPETSGEAA